MESQPKIKTKTEGRMEKRPFETRIDRDKRLGKMNREKVLCLINTILPTVAGVLFLISSFPRFLP